MPEPLVCPDVQQFERLRRGELSLAEVEQLAQHVEQCRLCAERLQSAELGDPLIQTICTLPTAIEPADKKRVAELMDRLKSLPLACPADTAAGEFVLNAAASDIVLSPPQAPDEIGRLGGYRILKMLGAGGMGMVYQAEDVRLQRPVALKVMKAALAKDPRSRERFLREARAAAKVKSDHVVTIYQVGEDRQIVFLAMEYLEGMSLAEWLDKGRKPTLVQAARMGRQIALGLAAAHERGLIHRDIKPGNIWLESNQQGRVKLLDFGLARGTADEVQLTQSGALIGTPAFMAPEQARGVKVDHRCDLFSLGVVLYRLTTGQMPFRGDNTMSLLTALALETPKPPREINPALSPRMAALIERLLSKDREQRPQTAKAVAEELAAIEREASQPAEEDTVKIRAATVRERPVPTAPSRSRLGWLAASLLLLLGGAAAAIVVIIRDKQGNPIAKIDVPEGGSIEIKNVDQPKNDAKKPPVVQQKAPIAAAPLPSLLPGAPLAPTALVQQPTKLPGVRSWSIEKRDSGMTTAVAYRPDGKRLAVGDWDGRVRIWEPQSGRLVQMAFETRPVGFLAWSPDGKMLAVGVSENAGQSAIQLWDAQAGRSLWRVETPPGGTLGALAWSADGRTLLATVTNVGCLTWNSADGRLLRTVAILCGLAAFSPDAKRLAGGTGENRVALWDVETGKEIRKLEEHKPAALSSLAWSPDGKSLALTAADGVYIWQAETGQRIGHYKDLSPCCFVCWSPDGRTFAATLGSGHGAAVVVVEVGTEGQPRRLEDDGLASLAWSPDGKTIARIAWGGGGYGGWVRLYDAATGKRQRSLTEGCEILSVAALSSDGQTIAVAKGSGITLSSTDTGQVIQRHKDTSGVFALSPDGKRLAAGGSDHTVILWEDGGKVRVPLLGHQQDATWLAWSPDGKRLASASAAEKRLLLWDADKGERLHELGPFPAAAQSPTWTPDGRFVAFFVSQVGWHFWDVERNQLANDPKQWKLDRLSLAPDGRSALVANMTEHFRLRDRATGKEGRQLPYQVDGHTAMPAWSPDGRLLAVPSEARVELWRGDLACRLRILPATLGYLQQVAFSADGKLVTGLAGERLHVWETDTGRLRGILLRGEKNNGLTIAPDGHYNGNEQVERGIVVVVQKDDGTQEVLEPVDFEKKYGWKNEPDKVHLLQPLPPPPYPLPGQPMGPNALVREPAVLPDVNSWTIETVNARGQVKAVAYRPDGKLLATGGEDGVIRIWDTSSGELVRMLIGDPAWSLSWSKDGILAAAYPFSGVSLWQTNTGRLLRRLEGGGIVAWSPDGRTLARLAGIGSLTLWDAKTEKDVRSYQFPSEGQALVWSPDGKTLAVGLPDKSARLWDVASGKETHKLQAQDGAFVRSIAWSPDGKRIATMGHEHSSAFHVWDTASGKLQGRFAVGGPINFSVLAWSPDGKAVAVGPYGLFDAGTGQRIRPFDSSRDAWAVAWAPDGSNQLAIAGNSGIHLLDAGSGKRTHTLEERSSDQWIKSFWSPDGRHLALSFQYQGSVSLPIVEAATGRRSYLLQDGSYWVSWSPDSKLLASNISGHTVGLWDAAATRMVRTLEGGGNMLARIMAWSPDSKTLAGADEQTIWVWSAETGKLLWRKDKQNNVSALAWSPDGDRLATTEWGDKGAVHIWQGQSGKLLQEASLPVYRLAWSPDGKRLAINIPAPDTGSHRLVLMDAASGKLLAKSQELNVCEAFHWSSDGKSFVTASGKSDGYYHICIWDGVSCTQLRSMRLWRIPGFYHAAWSPDGRILAMSNDSQIFLHDSDGHPLGVLLPFDVFGQLAVTADGQYRGNARVERLIRMVVQNSDGSSATLTPLEFEQKYGFKNDPSKVRLIEKQSP